MRDILHVDCDYFYAAVELLHRPEYKGKPFAVGGDPEQRHGIILAKSPEAKRCGVKTGEAIWEAKRKCPGLVVAPPRFQLYMRFSGMVRKILLRYSDMVEPFGLDESWVDISGTAKSKSAFEVADEIQKTVLYETGITVSIGVSYNKIFAKLGSDYKKPAGITVITKDNFREKVWPLPVSDLMMVGRSTYKKLHDRGVYTIGDLASTPPDVLKSWLGRNGETLYVYANGLDSQPVKKYDDARDVKSVGNSTTTCRDLKNSEQAKTVFYMLAESVSRRLRKLSLKGRVVGISVRDCCLHSFTRQKKQFFYTNLTNDIAKTAISIFCENYSWKQPVRSIGIWVSDLIGENAPEQETLFFDNEKRKKMENLETAVDSLKNRFGSGTIKRGCYLSMPYEQAFAVYDKHVIYPAGFIDRNEK